MLNLSYYLVSLFLAKRTITAPAAIAAAAHCAGVKSPVVTVVVVPLSTVVDPVFVLPESVLSVLPLSVIVLAVVSCCLLFPSSDELLEEASESSKPLHVTTVPCPANEPSLPASGSALIFFAPPAKEYLILASLSTPSLSPFSPPRPNTISFTLVLAVNVAETDCVLPFLRRVHLPNDNPEDLSLLAIFK